MVKYKKYAVKIKRIFLFLSPAKAIYGSFCRGENEIFNVVNYSIFRLNEVWYGGCKDFGD